MRTRALIRRGTPASPHDLWPRLRARLAEEDDVVRVAVPPLGWREAAAVAAVLGIAALVPDPLAFLAASGVL